MHGTNTISSTDSNGSIQAFYHPDSYGIDGWILPENNANAESLVDNNNLFPYNHLTLYRFVRFLFFSHYLATKSSWDIKINANDSARLERERREKQRQNERK